MPRKRLLILSLVKKTKKSLIAPALSGRKNVDTASQRAGQSLGIEGEYFSAERV
jgi:hypothetical protein